MEQELSNQYASKLVIYGWYGMSTSFYSEALRLLPAPDQQAVDQLVSVAQAARNSAAPEGKTTSSAISRIQEMLANPV